MSGAGLLPLRAPVALVGLLSLLLTFAAPQPAFGAASRDTGAWVRVMNGKDHGPGSLRAALDVGATRIRLDSSISVVSIESTLVYASGAPLTLHGTGQTIDGGGGGFAILAIRSGADVSLSDLTITDGGGYSVNQGGGEGILLQVPPDRVGTVRLSLTDVTVTGVGGHGVHVRDCARADCKGDEGSPASVEVRLERVRVDTSGRGRIDADGMRIDERGDGGIAFRAVGSSFLTNGADGVELDEGGRGDVSLDVRNSIFAGNGDYCSTVDPHEPADPACVEEGELEFDDGLDVDEAGAGDVTGRLSDVTFSDNRDQGLDVDESGAGGLDLDMVDVRAASNREEGLRVSERGAGDVGVRLRRCVAMRNGDDGVRIDESGEGDLAVSVHSVTITKNGEDGLQVEESGKGEGTLRIRKSLVEDGIQSDARRL